MKKILMVLMVAFTMTAGLFADVTLLPKDVFNKCIDSTFEDTSFVQPQIAYVADTWEDVYEKTGVDKYSWMSISSMYCDNETYQYFLIVKFRIDEDLVWICYELPGDGSETIYAAAVVH